jgi:hypothetical protein
VGAGFGVPLGLIAVGLAALLFLRERKTRTRIVPPMKANHHVKYAEKGADPSAYELPNEQVKGELRENPSNIVSTLVESMHVDRTFCECECVYSLAR